MTEWEDAERTFSIAVTTPSLGGLAPTASASYKKRQVTRFSSMLTETARAAGISVEEVEETLASTPDGSRIRILEELVLTAGRTSDRDKIRNLARTAANVLNGDDAVIQRVSVLLPTIVDLESVHVALLVVLRQQAQARVGGSPKPPTSVCEDELTLHAVVAQLIGRA